LDIGNFEGLGTIFTAEELKTYRAIVHKENLGDVHWIDGRTVEYEIQTPATVETRSDVNSDRSSVRIVATANRTKVSGILRKRFLALLPYFQQKLEYSSNWGC
jgi:hypothetical protein